MKLANPLTVVILSYYCAAVPASAADTTTYTYDALGRLTQSQVSGGVRSGVQQTYQHDAAGNRVYRNVLGPTSPRPSTVTAPSAVISAMGPTAALVANVAGTAPTGTVTFSIDGMVVGSAAIFNGQARAVIAGLQPGNSYTVTATYSGDANNDPTTSTFVVQIRDLSWLPAVLDLLLAD